MCCTEILYITVQVFFHAQINLFAQPQQSHDPFINLIQITEQKIVSSLLKLVLLQFYKLCTVPCSEANKCAVQKYCKAQYKWSSVLK